MVGWGVGLVLPMPRVWLAVVSWLPLRRLPWGPVRELVQNRRAV